MNIRVRSLVSVTVGLLMTATTVCAWNPLEWVAVIGK